MIETKVFPPTPLEDAWNIINQNVEEPTTLDPIAKAALRNHVEYLETKLGIAHATIQMCLTINRDSSPEEAILWLDKQWEKDFGD